MSRRAGSCRVAISNHWNYVFKNFQPLELLFEKLPIIGTFFCKTSNHWKFIFLLVAVLCAVSVKAEDQRLGGEEIQNALRIAFRSDGMRIESWIATSGGDYFWRGQTFSDDKSSLITKERSAASLTTGPNGKKRSVLRA